MLNFSMFFGDDYLELSIDPDHVPTSNYYISAGGKAKSIPNESLGAPNLTLKKIEEKNGGPVSYAGGLWNIDPSFNRNSTWQLTIKKYNPDPETTDVTVGPGTPGLKNQHYHANV